MQLLQTNGTLNNKVEEIKIFSTTKYSKFGFIKGNRAIENPHVSKLVSLIQERDLLKYNPIIVDRRLGVVDGQHRLKAAERLNVPIYYIVAEGITLRDISMLNSTKKSWRPQDYMESYIEAGFKDYKTLKEFAAEFKFSVSNAIAVLSIGDNRYLKSPMRPFKDGTWEITDIAKAYEFAKNYREISTFAEEKTGKDRDLMRAVYLMYYVLDLGVTHEGFMDQLKNYPQPIFRRLNAKDYLRSFEDIYNSNKKKLTRFM